MDDSLPPESRVGRVALAANDPDRLAAFYRDVVGLDRHGDSGDRATLGAGGDDLVVLNRTDAGPRPATSAGLFHLAVRVPSRAALGDALARAREWGLDGASDHGVSEALYLSDPEGNGVEIYRDRSREEWPTDGDRVAMVTERMDVDGVAAAAAGGDGVPPGTDVGHVHLEVTDLATARAFYADGLGLRVRQEWDASALFLAAGDYHHHVGVNTWNGRSEPATGRGLDWFELVLPDAGSLAAARERLREHGIDVTDTDEGVTVADPDGIELGLRLRA
jgi:catechol 2,3-dioxygenase